MDKLNCMKMFCTVVKTGGFTAAAKQAQSSKVLVSRAVSTLENDLGIRLLQRTTRKMSLTEDGRAYFERCQALIEEFDDLDNSVKDSSKNVQGRLRLSLPTEQFTLKHLLPFITDYAKKYPELDLDIMLVDRHVDIVDEGIDVAIRIGTLSDSTLIAKKLGTMSLLLCASKTYCQQHAEITSPKDIPSHSFILDTNYRGGQRMTLQNKNENLDITFKNKIAVNNAFICREFIKQGMGIGLCPDFMIADDLKKGELIQLLPAWEISQGGIYAVYSHRKHLTAKVSSFVNEISDYFQRSYSVS